VATYSSQCSASTRCCDPGAVCSSGSYGQCVPVQAPSCINPSGFSRPVSKSPSDAATSGSRSVHSNPTLYGSLIAVFTLLVILAVKYRALLVEKASAILSKSPNRKSFSKNYDLSLAATDDASSMISSQDNHSDWSENNDFNGRKSFDRLAMLDVQNMSATLDGTDRTFTYGDSNGNPVNASIYDGDDEEEKSISCVSSSISGINSTIIVTRKNCASSKDKNMAAATHNYADDSRTEFWVESSLSYDDVCMKPPKNSVNVEHFKNNNIRKEVWVENSNSLGYDAVYSEASKIIYMEDSSTDVWVDNSLSYDDIYMNPVGSYSIPCDGKFLIPESVQNQKQRSESVQPVRLAYVLN
jgi:hypothetical protein